MRKGALVLITLLVLVFLSSCFKEDEQVTPHVAGNLVTDTIPMTQNYQYQIYYDLATGSIISQNLRANSDLGFESSRSGWKVILNSANFMRLTDLGQVPFGQHQDTTSKKWIFDKSDGNPDSLAIGKWFEIIDGDTLSNNHVYAIDRGIDPDGHYLGLSQVIFDSLKGGRYYFRFADISGNNISNAIVGKDTLVNYQWFSFNSGGTLISNEPPKLSYDLLFTQYTTMLYTSDKPPQPYPYIVTGVLSNRFNTVVGIDTTHEFSTITLTEAKTISLSNELDKIGYDWKYYSFETGAYTMRENIAYIIRNFKGLYYKLRFIGFYNRSGQKGYPVIEFQAL